jgi:hypothetical protein
MSNNTTSFPAPPLTLPVSLLQKLGNAVNMFGMAVANEDHKVMDATKQPLIDVIHAVHPEKQPTSPIVQAR